MEEVFFSDSAPIEGVRFTENGYMVAQAKAGRAGIQHYAGFELGKPNLRDVRVYRPEDEVFSEDAIRSAAHRPVTVEHPSEFVTADNWKKLAVGHTGGEVMRDGGFVSVPLVLMDSEAIQSVKDGKRELSWGYGCRVEWSPGKTADGEEYDAIQRGIRINHLAVVDKGRAGPECRIGDAARAAATSAAPPTPTTPSPSTTAGGRSVADETNQRAVLLDGLTVRTNDAGAEAIARLQRQITDAATAFDAERTQHTQAIQARDGQIEALRADAARQAEAHQGTVAALNATHQQALDSLRGELDALRAQTSDAALDARVAARSALIASARAVLGDRFDATGMADAAIRRAVVAKALPTLAVSDQTPDTYVTAAFDAVMSSPSLRTAPAPVDPLRAALANGAGAQPVQDAASQQQAEIPAWKRAAMRAEKAHLNLPVQGA